MKFNFVEKFSGNFKLGSRHGHKFSLIRQAWADLILRAGLGATVLLRKQLSFSSHP
jgi:hypothetical protein